MAEPPPRKFKPLKQFRYLPKSVPDIYNKNDLKNHNRHLRRMFYTQPIVDTKPLKLDPLKWINPNRLRDEAARTIDIDKANKLLATRINTINKTKGNIDTYNEIAYRRNNNWKRHEVEMRSIEKENKEIYKLITGAHCHYDNETFDKEWKKTMEILRHCCKFPFVILDETKLRKQPSISCGLDGHKVVDHIRPVCFLEFKVIDGENIGRIYIELYDDFLPITVKNFLSICKGDNDLTYKNCPVHRILKNKFMESGDITNGNGRGGFSIYGREFPEENHILKHSKPGVVSMKRLPLNVNNSQFVITFSEMIGYDRKNVVFGYVIRGLRNLRKIEGYGRRIGKPYAEIVISDCGVVPREELIRREDVEKGAKNQRGCNVKGCRCYPCCTGEPNLPDNKLVIE